MDLEVIAEQICRWLNDDISKSDDEQLTHAIEKHLPGFTSKGVTGLLGADRKAICRRVLEYRGAMRVMEAQQSTRAGTGIALPRGGISVAERRTA